MTDFKIYKDIVFDSLKCRERDILPNQHLETIPLAPSGGLVYNVDEESPYYSDGLDWIPLGGIPLVGFSVGVDQLAVPTAVVTPIVNLNTDKDGQYNTGHLNETTGVFTCPTRGMYTVDADITVDLTDQTGAENAFEVFLRHRSSTNVDKGSYQSRCTMVPPADLGTYTNTITSNFLIYAEQGDRLFYEITAELEVGATAVVSDVSSIVIQQIRKGGF